MKPLVIYHDNCADGFGAAFAAWLKFGSDAEYIPMKYGFHVDDLDNIHYVNNEVYMVDFSWPKPLMKNLFEKAKKVVWLDHHKTAFEIWCGKYEKGMRYIQLFESYEPPHYILLDDNKSGAMIAWEYFHPDKEIPMLIKHIDDYDRWQFKLDGTKEFNKALWSYAPWSFEQWRVFAEFSGPMLISEGAAILRAHDQNVQAVVKGASRDCLINVNGCVLADNEIVKSLHGLAANCPPHLSSDVGHQLANQSGTYGLLWYINKEGKCLCSLRSNGDYDVSAIAKAFGGGGHKNAAGFETSISTLLTWIK